MAKIYVCDACKAAMENPYAEKMKEFYIGTEFDIVGIFPCYTSRKTTVHLCDKCYHSLRDMARDVRED